jgi:hypothetical protein
MYTDTNFKTKKALKEAVTAGKEVTYYQPGLLGGNEFKRDGEISVEGPHYPAAHSWYARCTVANGIITKVK